MTDLDKAREWANRGEHLVGVSHPDAQAAIEIIQSLPDQWVDVEKVEQILFHMREDSLFEESLHPHVNAFERLLAPKLPTLADMTAEEREACKWMQCKVETDDGDTIGVIRRILPKRAGVIFQSGMIFYTEHRRITPLPDLPKLQWPGSGDAPTIAQKEKVTAEQAIAKDVCNSESNHQVKLDCSINPEDVPANEPWLIEADGHKAIGTRYNGDTHAPWSVAALDGPFAGDYNDREVTLIHKLVPEPPALPEGMRLADHETLGRIVVSQRADKDGDYAFFESIPGGIAGASWGYVHKSELTFLDGDQHV